MKKIPFLFALCILGIEVAAQDNSFGKYVMTEKCYEYSLYAPIDSVPCWVQEIVTDEEYMMWKTLSHYFKVNYSVLLNDHLTQNEKERLYKQVKEVCEQVENKTYPYPIGTELQLNTVTLKPLPLNQWMLEERSVISANKTLNKVSCVIYRGKSNADIYLKVMLLYFYDNYSKKMIVLNSDLSVIPNETVMKESDNIYNYVRVKKQLYGECKATLRYKTVDNNEVEENVHLTYDFFPDKWEQWLSKGMVE